MECPGITLPLCKLDAMEPIEGFYLTDLPAYQYNDGSVFVGEMLEGMREGRGRLYFPNGSVLEGYWKGN